MGKSQLLALIAGALMASVGLAQAPADAPAGSTGLCKDGTYWSGATKSGACRGHKGVQTWYGSAAGGSTPATPTTSSTTAAPTAAPASPSATASPASPSAGTSTKAPAQPSGAAAPGGGPGMVWVNTASKVYHCPSDRWYGKTKKGAYMSESDAVAQGNRPDHGKACNK